MENIQFDSIICIGGEDWWYHNRGHYDFQIMRELSKTIPILYVNSIGMKKHSSQEGAEYLNKIFRKCRSLYRGLTKIRDNFSVFSPITSPGMREYQLGKIFLAKQINFTAKRLKFKKPLLWVVCPPIADILDGLHYQAMVYQRTDKMETFVEGEQRDAITQYDKILKSESRASFYCSPSLFEEEKQQSNAFFVDHGVDYDMFFQASQNNNIPADMSSIKGHKIGFIGGIDAHTFDAPFFLKVAKSLPNESFVMVGNCSLTNQWCTLDNVHFLSKKDYQEVPDYMAACDVLIMPWNQNEWIWNCNPIKLKEYLAVGKPIVSTPFAALKDYEAYITSAKTVNEFVQGILNGLKNQTDRTWLQSRVKDETWHNKGEQVLKILHNTGLEFEKNQ